MAKQKTPLVKHQLQPWLDVREYLEEMEFVSLNPGPSGDLLLLFVTRPADYRERHPAGASFAKITTPKRHDFLVVCANGIRTDRFRLPQQTWNYHLSLGSASSRLSYQWLRYTLPVQRFLLALDADDAGQQSRRIWQVVVGERGVEVPLSSGEDLTDYHLTGRSLRDLILPLLPADDRSSSGYPVVIYWPADAEIATIGDQWRRLPDGRIEATYRTADELELCLNLTRWIREETARPEAYGQAEMFDSEMQVSYH